MTEAIEKAAIISPCGKYRYRLQRQWSGGALLPFVMLNPSTADADIDDPTIRRCMGFARREGAAGIEVVNLFAFRATKPSIMLAAEDPVGPENERAMYELALAAKCGDVPIICAWGANAGDAGPRAIEYLKGQGATLRCLGKTAGGHPRHPLYVKADQPLEAL